MKAWLICNEFLQTNKFNEIHRWLVDAAKKEGIELLIKTNAELLVGSKRFSQSLTGEDRPKFILFWDKDIRLARALEDMGLRVFNSARAIEICDDKSYTYLTLLKAGILMPKTIVAPKTFDNIGYKNYDFLEQVEETLQYPFVMKECFGSFGQQVYMIHNKEELELKMRETGAKPVLFQEYIDSSFARDIRIQVVGDQVIASMYRYSDTGDFRANISNGGKMQPYEPTMEQKKLAIACSRAIGLDFAGVDLLFGEHDEPIVCEVNSNAHFKNIYDCTGINAAEAILTYICGQMEDLR